MQLLINEYHDAITKVDRNGRYPLHLACQYNDDSGAVLKLLIKRYPGAVQNVDSDGRYPLYLAAKYNQPESVIQLLIEKYPIALIRTYGYCPLYHVLENYFSEWVIAFINENLPGSVAHVQLKNGRFLLHYACLNNVSAM